MVQIDLVALRLHILVVEQLDSFVARTYIETCQMSLFVVVHNLAVAHNMVAELQQIAEANNLAVVHNTVVELQLIAEADNLGVVHNRVGELEQIAEEHTPIDLNNVVERLLPFFVEGHNLGVVRKLFVALKRAVYVWGQLEVEKTKHPQGLSLS